MNFCFISVTCFIEQTLASGKAITKKYLLTLQKKIRLLSAGCKVKITTPCKTMRVTAVEAEALCLH